MVAIPWDPVSTPEPTPEPTPVPAPSPPPRETATQIAHRRAALVAKAHDAMKAARGGRPPTPEAVTPARKPEEPKIKARGQIAPPADQAKAAEPWISMIGPAGDDQRMPALFGAPEGETPEYDDRPSEGQYAPIPGGGITMQDGSIQKGSSEYGIGGGFARVKEAFEAAFPGSKFTIFSDHGGIRTTEGNFQRILTNKKHWGNYFTPDAIARGNPTKNDLLPGKWEDLQRSPHVHASAADIALDADTGKYGTERGKDGRSYPSEAAMLNSSQGQWMYRDDSYNLLIRGWVPAGKGYGGSSGISDPNTGRKELWHIEYNPQAATEELRRLGYLDSDGFLQPPVADSTSRNYAAVAAAGDTSLYDQTTEEKLSEMTTAVGEELKGIERAFPDESVGQTLVRGMEISQKHHDELAVKIKATEDPLLKATRVAEEANAEVNRQKAIALSYEESLQGTKAGMAKATAEKLEELEQARIVETDRIMKGMSATAENIRNMDINAFRQFQFIEPKLGKDGKPVLDENGDPVTQLNPLKTVYTVAAGVALLANAFFTFKSAARKKGNKIPFLVWDMIVQSVNLDLKNQEAALDGEFSKLNADQNRLSDWTNYFGNRETAMLKQQELFFKFADTKILEATAGWKGQEALVARDIVLAESKAKQAVIAQQVQEKVAKDTDAAFAAQLQGITSRNTLVARKQEVLIKGLTAEASITDKKLRRKQLTPAQKNVQTQAATFVPVAKELLDLWNDAGGDENLMLKFVAKTGLFAWAPVGTGSDAAALHRIREIQHQFTAVLAKSMGEVGALAENEQIRAMWQIPSLDRSALGVWKLKRLFLNARMMASDQFYMMDAQARQNLISAISSQPSTPVGVRRASKILTTVLDEWTKQDTRVRIGTSATEERALAKKTKGDKAAGRAGAGGNTEKRDRARLARRAKITLEMENKKRMTEKQRGPGAEKRVHPGIRLGKGE